MGDNSVWFSEPVVNACHVPLSVRGSQRSFDERAVAELLEDTLLHVCSSQVILASPVNRFVRIFEALLWVENRLKYFVFNLEEVECFHGSCFIDCSDTRHKVTNVTNLLNSHCVLVLGNRKHAELMG
jgi:hypothetical protein